MPTEPTVKELEHASLLASPISVFADQMAQLSVGPFVSKLVFGGEAPKGQVPPGLVTITLPTPALIGMARNILQLIGQDDVVKEMTSDLQQHMEALRRLGTSSSQ